MGKKTYQGEWRELVNRSVQGTGRASIHDDEQARSLGFRRGFVVGSTVATAALPAIVDSYGENWFKGGWYTFKFVTPVYDDEEVREIAEPAEGGESTQSIQVRVENREGRICAVGSAGLGVDVPWDASLDGTRGATEVLPRIVIGQAYPPLAVTITADEVKSTLDAAREHSPWYREASPFGAPLVPPEHLMSIINRSRSGPLELDGVKPQQIWAEHSVVMVRPLLLETPYVAHTRVVDKGRSGRTAFFVEELELLDADGQRVALARAQTKFVLDE